MDSSIEDRIVLPLPESRCRNRCILLSSPFDQRTCSYRPDELLSLLGALAVRLKRLTCSVS